MKKIALWTVFGLLVLFILCPIWIALTGSISAQWELEENLGSVFLEQEGQASWPLLPKAPTLTHIVEVLLDSPAFFAMFWNSVAIAAAILLGQLLTAVPAAWALAQLPVWGKDKILSGYVLLMLMPFQVLMFPQYLVLERTRLLDSLWAVILPAVFSTFPVFLLYRFFRAIPKEILEAARLDGAGEWGIYWKIAVPMGKPGILAGCILTFLEAWNMIEQPMTYIKDPSLWPLSLFLPDIGAKELGLGFAGALMMLIPALLLFFSCQEYLEQGIALSGGKD